MVYVSWLQCTVGFYISIPFYDLILGRRNVCSQSLALGLVIGILLDVIQLWPGIQLYSWIPLLDSCYFH